LVSSSYFLALKKEPPAGMLVWCRAGSPCPAELPGRFKLSSGGGWNPRPTVPNLSAGCQHKGGFGLFYLLDGVREIPGKANSSRWQLRFAPAREEAREAAAGQYYEGEQEEADGGAERGGD